MKRQALSLFLVVGSIASFVACGSSDSSSGTAAATTTTSSAASGGASTTSGSNTSTGSQQTSTATTSTGTASGGASTTATTGAGGSAPASGYCRMTCTAASDCCSGLPNCPGSAYPYNPTCDNGFCSPAQCSADTDCNGGGALPSYKCLELNGFHFCGEGCMTVSDCTPVMGLTYTCGSDDNGAGYCEAMSTAAGCTMDSQCQGLGKCHNGTCDCDSNADCTVQGTACDE